MSLKLTVLETASRNKLCKTFTLNDEGKIAAKPYDMVKTFDVVAPPCNTIEIIDDLFALLSVLAIQPRRAVIRGVYKGGGDGKKVARTLDNFAEPAEGTRWVMLDIDGVEPPEGMNPQSSEAFDWLIQEKLPACFHDVSYVAQVSNSAGILNPDGTPYRSGVRVHLWFLLQQPVQGVLLSAYLEGFCYDTGFYSLRERAGIVPLPVTGIDLSVIKSAVQLHYTANPIVDKAIRTSISGSDRVRLVPHARPAVDLPDLRSLDPQSVSAKKKGIRDDWAKKNGYETEKMRIRANKKIQDQEYWAPPAGELKTGRELVSNRLKMGKTVVQLFFTDENTPGSWYVKKSDPWFSYRYGDDACIPLKELSEGAYALVRDQLGWITEVDVGVDAESYFPDGINWPENFYPFQAYADRIWFIEDRKDGVIYHPMCSPIYVRDRWEQMGNGAWGLTLTLQTPTGEWKNLFLSKGALYGREDFRKTLAEAGASFYEKGDKGTITNYLERYSVQTLRRVSERIGWIGQQYVLPAVTIGTPDGEESIGFAGTFQPDPFATGGELAEWQRLVFETCQGNSNFLLALAVAFCGPLLTPLRLLEDNIGVYLRGSSSSGKTTALRLAASVWGDPGIFVQSWRATSNALESMAEGRNDSLLVLDELGQAGQDIGAAVYLLGNKQGKVRLRQDASQRPVAQFRLAFLASGEVLLADLMEWAGDKVMAGQELRFLDVDVTNGRSTGVVQALNGMGSSKELIDRINAGVRMHHGWAGRVFLERFLQLPEERNLMDEYQSFQQNWATAELGEAEVDGQVRRAAYNFGALAFAGELAIDLGVLLLPGGSIRSACAELFQLWRENRGGDESSDLLRAELELKRKLLAQGQLKFTFPGYGKLAEQRLSGEMWGDFKFYDKGKEDGPEGWFRIPTEVFRREFCQRVDQRAFTKYLADKGILEKSTAETATITIFGSVRCFRVRSWMLGDVAEGEPKGETNEDWQKQDQFDPLLDDDTVVPFGKGRKRTAGG
ncbi:DUF927 domain-containing protein [Acidithiobacillus sp. IBUN Pt1247-S3]|uniref:DUF927 domain-containing protein n=1 Tax=Acidithiobacillus sp. IBUN Pt1247-S3 TaxID=3166642 RepID=UPI0034E5DD3E